MKLIQTYILNLYQKMIKILLIIIIINEKSFNKKDINKDKKIFTYITNKIFLKKIFLKYQNQILLYKS